MICSNLDHDQQLTKNSAYVKGTNTIIHFTSSVLGAISAFQTLEGGSTQVIGKIKIANSCTSFLAAGVTGYTCYKDWKNDEAKGTTHLILNGMNVLLNTTSAALNVVSATLPPSAIEQKNRCSFISSLLSVGAQMVQAGDLYLTTPTSDKKNLH